MDESASAAADFKRRRGQGDSRGPAGMMDCAGYGPCHIPARMQVLSTAPSHHRYGPCDIPGVPAPEQTRYAWFEPESCGAVTPHAVLQRLCARMETDEPLYQAARLAFDARVAAAGASLVRRAQLLNQAGAALALQSKAQASLDPRTLAGAVGVQLSHHYKIPLPNGFIWDVDEFASWYKPHERARLSCANCSGDVVPAFDLGGCWPLCMQVLTTAPPSPQVTWCQNSTSSAAGRSGPSSGPTSFAFGVRAAGAPTRAPIGR